MAKTFDLYRAGVDDVEAARALVEQALGIEMRSHESMYWGGRYYFAKGTAFGDIAVRSNFNSFTGALNKPEFPDCWFLVYVDDPPEPDLAREKLVADGLLFLKRGVVEERGPRMIVVDARDAASRGFAAVTIEVDTESAGMFPRPFPWDDLLVVLNGPAGAPLALCVWSCGTEGAAEPDLETLVRAKFVPSWDRNMEVKGNGSVVLDGEDRPALTFATGDGPERVGWFAATIQRPGGMVLVAAGVPAGKAESITIEQILSNRSVGAAVRTLVIR